MQCQICLEDKKSMINCPSCESVSCEGCLKTFFATAPIDEPKCFLCSKVWTREFIQKNFKKSIQQDYKKMREKYLLEKEKILLPTTQQKASFVRQGREEEKELEKMKQELDCLQRQYYKLKKIKDEKQHRVYRLKNGYGIDELPTKVEKFVSVVCKCPKEACRGFVNNDTWTCGLCNTTVCKSCSMVKDFESHTCQENDILSTKEIKKSSKPCPKCAIPIFKIDGCDQMWCIQCHCAFSWKSGFEVTGAVHNPHFYEWQRRTNGGVAPRTDQPLNQYRADRCDNLTFSELIQVLPPPSIHHFKDQAQMECLHRFKDHILDLFRTPREPNNEDLRIKFLLNDITEENLAKQIQIRDKRYQKEKEISQIIEVFSFGARDIFQKMKSSFSFKNFGRNVMSLDQLRKYCEETDQLNVFVNECFKSISDKYESKLLRIELVDISTSSTLRMQIGGNFNHDSVYNFFYAPDGFHVEYRIL